MDSTDETNHGRRDQRSLGRPPKVRKPAVNRRWPRTKSGKIAAVLGVTVLVVAVLAGSDLWLMSQRIRHVEVNLPSSENGATWLLVGSDSRRSLPAGPHDVYGTVAEAPGSHADAVIVVHVDRSKTSVISIPRDIIVSPAPGTVSRLALTLNQDPQQLIDGLCRTLHIPVTHLVIVKMKTFAAAVDSLGGISLDNPAAVRDTYTGLNLRKGTVRLNGVQLLALVRSRHPQTMIGGRWVHATPSQGAQERATSVGIAFRALAERAHSTLSRPFQLHSLAWAMTEGLTTNEDTGLFSLIRFPLSAGRVTVLPVDVLGSDGLHSVPNAATRTVLEQAGYTKPCQVSLRR